MKQYSHVESVALKHAAIAIKAYKENADPNTGLREYNMVMHETIHHTDCVICNADGKTKTYKCGLNENAKEIQTIKNPEEKEAKIKTIRTIVKRAEELIAGNYTITEEDISATDPSQFWKKVTSIKPVIADVFDNKGERELTYWDQLVIELTNDGLILDPEVNVKDELLICAILDKGFAQIAPSYAECKKGGYKFYLDKHEDTSLIKAKPKIDKSRAESKIVAFYDKDAKKLLYIAKLISNESMMLRTTTPKEYLVEECLNYLDGLLPNERSPLAAVANILKLSEMTVDELKVRCLIKDGKSLRHLTYKDSQVYHIKTSNFLGKNDEEAVEKLKANETCYRALVAEVEKEWAK